MANPLFRKKSIQKILTDLEENPESDAHGALHKNLSILDLTFFGIAAIIGAGIFGTIGKASADGGPAVIFLFLFTALACGFAAFAYAEFASMIPVSGSAYTYSYVAFGELFAWIIGWALIMEYAIGNIVVAISWSDYFTTFCQGFGLKIPEWLTMDYFTAQKGYHIIQEQLKSHSLLDLANNPEFKNFIPAYHAWELSPQLLGFHFILDLPALVIVFLITWLVYRGMQESKTASNIMVIIKLAVVLLVIAVGAFYVNPENWNPFAPNGISGVLKGVSAVFFAYIGFDAISTTAEECKNPQKDLPRGMMFSIVICTVLYMLIALVITGMVSYKELAVGDPLAYVFDKIPSLHWLGGVISLSAVVAMASVLLVFQMGQPRIWMSMSRDGLLPPAFAKIHPKFRTPSFSTIVTGFLVGIPILFADLNLVVDVCSLGTLFAFALVCGGVLTFHKQDNLPEGRFKTPFISAKYLTGLLFLMSIVLPEMYFNHAVSSLFSNFTYQNIPMIVFYLAFGYLSILAYQHNYSLIPLLGMICCIYMMAQLGAGNWFMFAIWLVIGLVIYFGYGSKHSKLASQQ